MNRSISGMPQVRLLIRTQFLEQTARENLVGNVVDVVDDAGSVQNLVASRRRVRDDSRSELQRVVADQDAVWPMRPNRPTGAMRFENILCVFC